MPPKNAFRCVVGGCKSRDVICHRFPNPRTDMERLKTWMEIVGLKNEDPCLVYAKKYVCSLHFTSDCSSIGTKRLNAKALPSLFLHSDIIELDTVQTDSNRAGLEGFLPTILCMQPAHFTIFNGPTNTILHFSQ
ncbi:uncharacterized protein LOC100571446 [Acyrthosiphon pisum]|uniref:THAP-type domain-containing protein n=1 Tax=Acyrthosiphon pisum TaxID=7029 RepID=A0A8R2A4X1_ACYPI|nr:uncharacterized protein LOC100571446 [Acyrthosiphon pisum]|eukprot:XP_003243106.1 PREDICTED: uncharacterized protein LOC100571446 [Acyrthosiphon pisum]